MDNNLFSLRVEKHFLSGYLRFSNIFPEVDQIISEFDFSNTLHSTIYCIARGLYLKQEKFDKVLLGQKIKNLNITFSDDLNLFDYIENLYFTQITEEGALKASKQLSFLRVKRELFDIAAKIQSKVKEDNSDNIDILISECDRIYNDKINKFTLGVEPQDLFGGMPEIIEERGRNPVNETGLITPHKDFNRLFGGVRAGNVYAFVSRPGEAKTTVLNDIAFRSCLINEGCRALVLDTEMDSIDIKFRLASSLTGIPVWFLETGQYRQHKQFCENLDKARDEFKKSRGLIDHLTVSNKPIQEVESMIRRWVYKKIGRNGKAIIIYDYLKMTGEVDRNKAEYQILGNKVDSLKELSLSLGVPILTACQLNRSAVQGIDDSSAVAISDRLMWFCSFVAIFRRKTTDEILDDGLEFGSHKLIPLKTRFQGRDASGHLDLVRVPNGHGKFKYVKNFLNYEVKNFKVTELGGLREILKSQANIHHIQDPNDSDGQLI